MPAERRRNHTAHAQLLIGDSRGAVCHHPVAVHERAKGARAVRHDDVVCVDKPNPIALGPGKSRISRCVRAGVLDSDDPHSRVPDVAQQFRNVPRIPVVDDDQLQTTALLGKCTANGSPQPRVMRHPHRHDQRDKGKGMAGHHNRYRNTRRRANSFKSRR